MMEGAITHTKSTGRDAGVLINLIAGIKNIGNYNALVACVGTLINSATSFGFKKSLEFYELADQASRAIDNNQDPLGDISKMREYIETNGGDSIVGQPRTVVRHINRKYFRQQEEKGWLR